MPSLIDVSAEALRAEAPVFTWRNLYFAVRRSAVGAPRGAALTEAAFGATLRRRLARGPLPGLLPERRSRRLPDGWDADFPKAVLLVDRPAIADLFAASGGIAPPSLAVVCVDGTPKPVVAWLARGFRAGHRAAVLYLHDAATVLYPFAIEPLATLVRQEDPRPLVYRDLGLPPLGAAARRFGDPTLPNDEPILDLEQIPPATLLRHCATSLLGMVPAAPGPLGAEAP